MTEATLNDAVQSAATSGRTRWGGKGVTAAIAVCAALAVGCIALWAVQLSGGLVQTGMRNLDSWGIYITSFMFWIGMSAGGLIISSVPNAFGMKGFGGIAKIAIWSSICCTVVAAAFVVIDLGNPQRLWELVAFGNLTSPLVWDIIVITTYLVLSVLYLRATLRYEQGKTSRTAIRAMSAIALVVAVLVHSVTAWILGLQAGREFWHTALLAPWFVSSALVCGTGLVLVLAIALRRAGYMKLAQENVVKLAKMLGAFVCVDLYFFGCDLLTSAYPMGQGLEVVTMLVSGPLAPFFWTEVLGCILCAVVCFAPKLRTNGMLVVAGLLGILAIFCKRVQLLVGGFQLANIQLPGVLTQYSATNGTDSLAAVYTGMVYWPTPLEFGIVACVVGVGALLLMLGLRYLPLQPTETSH